MGLIKSTNAPASITPFSLADIERHAKTILLRAQQQAEQLLAAAQGEAVELKAQARAEGLAEGLREGTEKGAEQGRLAGQQLALNEHRARLTQVLTALTGAATALDSSRGELESVGLAEVVKLSIAIARRVTKRQGLIDSEVLTANLAEAMNLVVHSADIRIAIHPSQRATLNEALPKLRMQWPALTHVHLIDDPALDPGGCRVFTEHGQIDADLSGQLDRIAAELLPIELTGADTQTPRAEGA